MRFPRIGNIFINFKSDALVVSFGGVGTSFLITELSKYIVVNDATNSDGYKHLPLPPLTNGMPAPKILYITGDPIIATLSLFRRGYQIIQSSKLQKYYFKKRIIPRGLTIEDYSMQQVDRLFLKRHFENWHSKYRYYETLVVKYEAIYSSLSDIKNFLDLPDAFIDEFPTEQKRASSIHHVSANCLEGLDKMYGDLKKEIDQLPDCRILNPSKKPHTLISFCQPRYLFAFLVELKTMLYLMFKK